MKRYSLLISSLLFTLQLIAQSATTGAIYFPSTTQQNRARLYKQMVDTSIRLSLSDPLSDSTEGEWNEAFWSIELLVYKNDFVTKKLRHAWKLADSLSEDFQKNLIEVAYAVYPIEFKLQATKLLNATTSIPVFIRCAEYLLQADPLSTTTRNFIQASINTKFPGNNNPGLVILEIRLTSWNKTQALPP